MLEVIRLQKASVSEKELSYLLSDINEKSMSNVYTNLNTEILKDIVPSLKLKSYKYINELLEMCLSRNNSMVIHFSDIYSENTYKVLNLFCTRYNLPVYYLVVEARSSVTNIKEVV